MNLVLQLIGVTLSLTHITLNIFKIRLCWVFNFAALCVWVFLYARLRMPLVMGLMVVYQILSVVGWIKWGKGTLSKREKRKWDAMFNIKCGWCGKDFSFLRASCGTGTTWSLYRRGEMNLLRKHKWEKIILQHENTPFEEGSYVWECKRCESFMFSDNKPNTKGCGKNEPSRVG